MSKENWEALAERIKYDYDQRTNIKNQADYCEVLRKELGWDSLSQSTLSRRMKQWGYTTKKGVITMTEKGEQSEYKTDMSIFLSDASRGYRMISDTFIFLGIGSDYSNRAKKNLRGLFSKSILSVFTDDEGNLLILTYGLESTKKITEYLGKEFHLNEI
jgi:arginine repressor